MAGSRVEKIYSVFKRVDGLIKAEALAWNDRPIWYDVMKRFPPRVEPRFDRAVPTEPVRKIFYPEDLVRAKFYREFSSSDVINLKVYKDNLKIKSELFVDEYLKNQRPGASVDEIFNETEEKLMKEGKKYFRIKKKSYVEPSPLLHEEEAEPIKKF